MHFHEAEVNSIKRHVEQTQDSKRTSILSMSRHQVVREQGRERDLAHELSCRN